MTRALLLAITMLMPAAAHTQSPPAAKPELKEQPGLLALVQPRIPALREAGVSQIIGRTGARNNIQVLTRFGPAYVRWPRGITPFPFELYFNDNATNAAFAAEFSEATRAQYAAAVDAIVPAALKAAANARAASTRPKA